MAGTTRSIGGLAKKAAKQQKSATIKLGGSTIRGNHKRTGARNSDRDTKPQRAPRAVDNTPAEPTRPPVRDSVRPDATVLAAAKRARAGTQGNRGSVITSAIGTPADGTRAVRSLQAFSKPAGRRTVLGH